MNNAIKPNLSNRLLMGVLYFKHCFPPSEREHLSAAVKPTENSMAPLTDAAPSELPLLLLRLFEAVTSTPPQMNCNENQRRTMHPCFWRSLKATLPRCQSEPKMWKQWFVSGNRPPPCSVRSQWHPCVPTHFWCCDKFLWHAATPTLPRLKRGKGGGGSKSTFFLEKNEGNSGSYFHLPTPLFSDGLEAVTPH